MDSIQEYVNLLALIDSLDTNFGLKAEVVSRFSLNIPDLENPRIENYTDANDGTLKSYEACTVKPIVVLKTQGTSQVYSPTILPRAE